MSEETTPYTAVVTSKPKPQESIEIGRASDRWLEITGEDLPKEALAIEPAMVEALVDIFAPFASQVQQYAVLARGIKVEGEEDVDGMAEARQVRLALVKVRGSAEQARENQKFGVTALGRLIDWLANKNIRDEAKRVEDHLKELETTAERAEHKRKYDLRMEREKLLIPYVMNITQYKLDEMTEEAFNQLLTGSRLAHELKQEQEAKAAEAARLEREAELDRQIKMHEENKKLRAEADTARTAIQALRAQEAERERARAEEAAADARQKAAWIARGADKVRLGILAGKLEDLRDGLPTFDDPKIGDEIIERLANVFAYIKATSETL